jgi:hypothetical protein
MEIDKYMDAHDSHGLLVPSSPLETLIQTLKVNTTEAQGWRRDVLNTPAKL